MRSLRSAVALETKTPDALVIDMVEEGLSAGCHTTFNLKNLRAAISMTYCSTRYLINDTLLDNFAHLPTSYLRILS
jgi:hypothetical protein